MGHLPTGTDKLRTQYQKQRKAHILFRQKYLAERRCREFWTRAAIGSGCLLALLSIVVSLQTLRLERQEEGAYYPPAHDRNERTENERLLA